MNELCDDISIHVCEDSVGLENMGDQRTRTKKKRERKY